MSQRRRTKLSCLLQHYMMKTCRYLQTAQNVDLAQGSGINLKAPPVPVIGARWILTSSDPATVTVSDLGGGRWHVLGAFPGNADVIFTRSDDAGIKITNGVKVHA